MVSLDFGGSLYNVSPEPVIRTSKQMLRSADVDGVLPPSYGYGSETCFLVQASKMIWGGWMLVVAFEFGSLYSFVFFSPRIIVDPIIVVCILLMFQALSACTSRSIRLPPFHSQRRLDRAGGMSQLAWVVYRDGTSLLAYPRGYILTLWQASCITFILWVRLHMPSVLPNFRTGD